jgi:hypothetical protein
MTNRLIQAIDFARESDRPHVYGEARAKILELVGEINKVYRTHMLRSTGKVCDICGKGDTNEKYKVKDVMAGYHHREADSPVLCYGHASGWTLSYCTLRNKRLADMFATSKYDQRVTNYVGDVLSDEEVDLHFAHYLAKQLCKQVTETRKFKNERN